MEFVDGAYWSDPTNLMDENETRNLIPREANHRYYLTTWNNTAMIQTGHSNGNSTEDERKVLANTLFYLKQLTKKTEVLDNSARDIADPNNPSNIATVINENNSTNVKFRRPEDNGSTYEYYVKGLDGSREFTSDTKSATITTGVKKYKYIIDENPTLSKELIAEAGTEYESRGENEEIAIGNIVYNDNRAKYIHIYAIDGAGNTSEVYTQKLEPISQELEVTKEVVNPKNEYKVGNRITYKVSVRIKENETNKGEYLARNISAEEKIGQNGSILKETVKILNNKGEDVTKKVKDLKVEKDRITFTLDKIEQKESYKLVYDVKYDEIEKAEEITSVTKVKGTNTKEEIIVTKNTLNATVKETELEIEKTVEKKEVRAGEKNTYIVTLRNIGKYDAKDVEIEDILEGNAKYVESSVKLEDNNNLDIKHLGNARFKINLLPKGAEVRVRYEVEYTKQEEDSVVTNKVKAKGSNTKEVIPKEKEGVRVKVIGVKDLVQRILPKAGENSRIWIYIILGVVILMPTMIVRREYIEAKKRQQMRIKKRNRKR